MNGQDQRLEWVAPTVTELDIVAETQSGTLPHQPIPDGVTAYS